MPKVNYYLKKAEGNPPRHLVYLQMRYHGEKFVYSMKFNIEKSNWDKKQQLVKERKLTIDNGKVNANDLLKTMKEICLKTYNTEFANGIPSKEALKKALDGYMNQNRKKEADPDKPTLYTLIQDFIDRRIGDRKSGKKRKSDSTIITYKTSLKHLQEFERQEKYRIDFDTINLIFQNKYLNFLERDRTYLVPKGEGKGLKKVPVKGMSPNSVVKEIKNLKTFMNKALDMEYTTNGAFKKSAFSVEGELTDAVYLTEKEIRHLYGFDLSQDKRLEPIRDLFVLSCFVGLRISDATRVTPENIVKIDGDTYIKIKTQKTGQVVTIPCNDVVLDIFDKYKDSPTGMPPIISDQKYNDYIKEVCEKAGMTEKGRLDSDLTKPLYKAISSHTARRSFATNCYLDGMDNQMIMAVTGHKSEKSFLLYIKVTREENAKRMNAHMKKSLSRRHMKVAG